MNKCLDYTFEFPIQWYLCWTARRATLEDKKALVEKVDAFIFDCDGKDCVCQNLTDGSLQRGEGCVYLALVVVYAVSQNCEKRLVFLCCAGVVWRGDSVIDGVPETLDMLRSMVNPSMLQCASTIACWERPFRWGVGFAGEKARLCHK